ncbi:CopD family protein [Massilia sp. Mn16-1_5]|uniref:CopD family protein n=1 Tax=Massilia sp. Mn16-1_5 TaxID=2079199 RepID=UPI00109ECA24|nr:CopD family protein [Massilia sp. Mn16-1_5]THC39701.1 copper resistance protein CopD [Massilia sp. Mn16-1_5]
MDRVALLQVTSVWLVDFGFAWLVGSWFARRWLQAAYVPAASYQGSLRQLDLAAAGLVMASSAAAFWAATAVMGGFQLAEAGPMLWTMLATTSLGHAGAVGLAAIALLLLCRLIHRPGRAADGAVLLLLVVFTVTRASMGHAGEQGFLSMPLAAESIHLFAIALWVGMVMVSGWFVLDRAEVDRPKMSAYLDAMSNAAMVAVTAIVATGLYSAWHRVGTAEHLVGTDYGITLLVKVVLVVFAIALGGYNKFFGLPAAGSSAEGQRTVRFVLRLEAVAVLGALAAAAFLVSQQPPSAM